MGMASSRYFHKVKNSSGQTVVEYILLITVVFSLLYTFYNSRFFRETFGTTGNFATGMKNSTEFGYRHAFMHKKPIPPVPATYQGASTHPSYSGGRFFGAKEPYR